ncbi:MAG: response regulator transcription factor [Nitrospira sp.]|nr:response regulator transcription factor [Nitrospira sp.]
MRGNAYVTSLLGSRPTGALPGSDDEEDQLASLGMSQRQREVVTLLASGKTIKETAFQLGLSRKTVEHHKAMFREKFGIETDADLTKFAIKHGLTGTDWIQK